jgi:hypothetical protein
MLAQEEDAFGIAKSLLYHLSCNNVFCNYLNS